MLEDALAVQQAGGLAMAIETVAGDIATLIAENLSVPTIVIVLVTVIQGNFLSKLISKTGIFPSRCPALGSRMVLRIAASGTHTSNSPTDRTEAV